jgi:hypothetical protein
MEKEKMKMKKLFASFGNSVKKFHLFGTNSKIVSSTVKLMYIANLVTGGPNGFINCLVTNERLTFYQQSSYKLL